MKNANAGEFNDYFERSSPPEGARKQPLDTPAAVTFNKARLFWCGRNIAVNDAGENFLVCGGIGAGKSLMLELFLQSIAPRFQSSSSEPEQLVVFDGKCDLLETLAGLGYQPTDPNVWFLHPFDRRGVAWNIAEDVQDPAMARCLADSLLPNDEQYNRNHYFTEGAREIIWAVILGLNTARGKDWTLRDLVCALASPDRIRQLTARNDQAAALVNLEGRSADAILSTLSMARLPLWQVAAQWHQSAGTRRFSIEDFLARPGILVLGNDPESSQEMTALHSLFLQVFTRRLLTEHETPSVRRWIVLDEFSALPPGICDILIQDRAKGTSTVIAIQSLASLISIYGEQAAKELVGQFQHLSFLPGLDFHTASEAEARFRDLTTIQIDWLGDDGQFYRAERHDAVPANLFLAHRKPGKASPFLAVSRAPDVDRALIYRVPIDTLLAWRCKRHSARVTPTRLSRQRLQDWSREEELLMGGF